MTQKIFVTDAQIKAARMLVDLDRELGRETDEATRAIAAMGRDDDEPPSPAGRRGPPHRTWEADVSRSGTSFWVTLNRKQRDQLRSVGTWRTFPVGAVLMREGDPADHVIVILGGRAKVSVDSGGREHVLALRGVGQLIGERAAQSVNVRSATVTALEMVWALVVQTRDFAAFTMVHPDVLTVLENQLWNRLSEEPPRPGPRPRGWRRFHASRAPARPDAGLPGPDLTAGRPQHRPEPLTGENRTVLLSAPVGFGSGPRTDDDRALIRRELRGMMDAAVRGISDVRTEDRGDGLLTMLPAAVSSEEVMRLLARLAAALERHNRDRRDSARFELRLTVNVGPVSRGSSGFSGEAVNIAANCWTLRSSRRPWPTRKPAWASSSRRSSTRPSSDPTGTWTKSLATPKYRSRSKTPTPRPG
jgi:CRP-like cAMP-binding protein